MAILPRQLYNPSFTQSAMALLLNSWSRRHRSRRAVLYVWGNDVVAQTKVLLGKMPPLVRLFLKHLLEDENMDIVAEDQSELDLLLAARQCEGNVVIIVPSRDKRMSAIRDNCERLLNVNPNLRILVLLATDGNMILYSRTTTATKVPDPSVDNLLRALREQHDE